MAEAEAETALRATVAEAEAETALRRTARRHEHVGFGDTGVARSASLEDLSLRQVDWQERSEADRESDSRHDP